MNNFKRYYSLKQDFQFYTMTLENLYKEILEDKNKWNYYNKCIVAPNLDSAESCCKFIKNFIKLSGKSKTKLFCGIDFLCECERDRLQHIVSTFFLGISLYYKSQTIKQAINTKLNELMTSNENKVERQFCYIWFMTALFHDLGYSYEIVQKKRCNCIENPLNNLTGVPTLYNNVLESYNTYRQGCDHGIVAGKLLYDKLCEIRQQEYNMKQHNHEYCSDLYWGEDLEAIYKYVASCISVHNIFFIRDGEGDIVTENYYKENMPSLILKKSKNGNNSYDDYPINLNDYPLLFLLCLVDSIEPLKLGQKLNKVKIKLNKRTVVIETISEEYSNRIVNLNKWLTKAIKLKPKCKLGAEISL